MQIVEYPAKASDYEFKESRLDLVWSVRYVIDAQDLAGKRPNITNDEALDELNDQKKYITHHRVRKDAVLAIVPISEVRIL